MLVLTRKADQSILIGDDIEIKIVQIKGSGVGAQVRLGIEAPRGVTILRREVYDAVREENLRAARQGAGQADPVRLMRMLSPEAADGKKTDQP